MWAVPFSDKVFRVSIARLAVRILPACFKNFFGFPDELRRVPKFGWRDGAEPDVLFWVDSVPHQKVAHRTPLHAPPEPDSVEAQSFQQPQNLRQVLRSKLAIP